ncbi:MAG: transcription elongation factor GreA [Pseudomonadales bacterium]|jgi:transcription elongation factor GreA|nr:transcription elongation factor GreA [Pseudomonadales bacterium]
MKKAPTEVITLSPESHQGLVDELNKLKDVALPKVIARIAKAREQGDLSENSEYKDAKDEQELLEVRIDEIETILAKAKISKGNTGSKKGVAIGSTVTIKDDGKKVTYKIVGEFDAAASNLDAVSAVSPLGKALLGKEAGDKVEVTVPAGTKTIEVVSFK